MAGSRVEIRAPECQWCTGYVGSFFLLVELLVLDAPHALRALPLPLPQMAVVQRPDTPVHLT